MCVVQAIRLQIQGMSIPIINVILSNVLRCNCTVTLADLLFRMMCKTVVSCVRACAHHHAYKYCSCDKGSSIIIN